MAIALTLATVGVFAATAPSDAGRDNMAHDDSIEIVHVERNEPSSPESAMVIAFAALSGKMALSRPLFAECTRGDDGASVVRLCDASDPGSRHTNPVAHRPQTELASVVVRGDEVEVKLPEGTGLTAGARNGNAAVVAAVVYLREIGALSDHFLLETDRMEGGDVLVVLTRVPLMPGGHTGVIVAESGMNVMRGL